VSYLRSKAVLVLMRSTRNASMAKRQQSELDHRVRANAVEGLWNHSAPETLEFLRTMARDDHHRVRANAIVGLHLLHEPDAPSLLLEMLSHESIAFRRAAVWALGYLGGPDYVERLVALRRDANPEIRGCAIRALACLRLRAEAEPDATSPPALPAGHKTETV